MWKRLHNTDRDLKVLAMALPGEASKVHVWVASHLLPALLLTPDYYYCLCYLKYWEMKRGSHACLASLLSLSSVSSLCTFYFDTGSH